MYSYIKRMCNACPGCALANPTKSKSSELVYNFPIKAPFLVLFIDAYSAGKHSSFDGSEVYLVACCGMTGFASMEPIQHANSKNFASGIMKIQLRYGFCHTVVLDKDSKFFGVCCEALDLLQINCHVLSGDNHNPMIVESVNPGDTILTLPVMYTGPPPSAPTYSTPTIPPLSILSRSIIQSSAKLFFIRAPQGGTAYP